VKEIAMSTDAIARGQAAAREYAETEAAFSALKAAMIGRLFTTPMNAAEERERLYHAVQTLDAVRMAMREVIDSGRIEAAARDAASVIGNQT
jgi:hypothetical protein